MNMETEILIATALLSAASLLAACICFKKQRKNHELLEFTCRQIEELEESLAANSSALSAAEERAADRERRLARLETRILKPETGKKDVLDETTLTERPAPQRLNITERRHRVLALAGRGQNAETIAATLGMLPGEVQLIINLNRANFARVA